MRFHTFTIACFSITALVACNSSSDGGSPSGAGGATDANPGTGGTSAGTGGATAGTGGTSAGTGGATAGTGGAAGQADAGGGCSTKALTCGVVLSTATLTSLQPNATGYVESGKLPCHFTLPSSSGGIFQVFCGDATLFTKQLTTAQGAYPGDVTETDTIGTKSFEMVVGPPKTLGSSAEVDALTTSGKYVFNVSMSSAAADIAEVRKLAQAIDSSLSGI